MTPRPRKVAVPGVTVCIPTIPPRSGLLARAVGSVMAQTEPAAAIAISVDREHLGAPVNRTRALAMAKTEWVCFLDDDDELKPEYIEHLQAFAKREKADLVYGWFDVIGGVDPFPSHFGKPWDPGNPLCVSIGMMVKTALAQKVGGFDDIDTHPHGYYGGEDYWFICKVNNTGAKIAHLPERLFNYHHHGGNTSGRPDRW